MAALATVVVAVLFHPNKRRVEMQFSRLQHTDTHTKAASVPHCCSKIHCAGRQKANVAQQTLAMKMQSALSLAFPLCHAHSLTALTSAQIAANTQREKRAALRGGWCTGGTEPQKRGLGAGRCNGTCSHTNATTSLSVSPLSLWRRRHQWRKSRGKMACGKWKIWPQIAAYTADNCIQFLVSSYR